MQTIRHELATWIAAHVDRASADALAGMFQTPKPEFGDVALPVFRLAVGEAKKPDEKAAKLAEMLSPHPLVASVAPERGFLNITLKADEMARRVLPEFDEFAAAGFILSDGRGKLVTIDYSSPNVAKEFSLGHLRSTMLGHSLLVLYQANGWDTVGINHLGDWGHQFGVVIHAFEQEGDDAALEADPIRHLQSLYTKYAMREKAEAKRADAEAKGHTYDPYIALAAKRKGEREEEARLRVDELLASDPYLRSPKLPSDPGSVTQQARHIDVKLQERDPRLREIWSRFKDLSVRALEQTYERLGVRFDHYTGESFFEDKMAPIVELAEQRGVLTESQGARVIELDDPKLPPAMLCKSDGGSTYLLRDLAAATYRRDEFAFDRNVYVVDARQSDHFKQVFGALKRMGFDWAEQCLHVPFGAVKVDGEVMSTRLGNVILMEDFVALNTDKVLLIMQEKNPALEADIGTEAFRETARHVAQGAILFEMLKVDRNADVDYRSEQALSFEGETGPRVQMVYAKTGSVMRTYADTFGRPPDPQAFDANHYTTQYERQLLRLLGEFPSTIRRAAADHQPYLVARHALDVADWLNLYWRHVRFVDETAPAESASRVALLMRIRATIQRCLHLLGIATPERM